MINSNQLIQGITIDGASLKISQYADDTVIITDGSEMSLFEVNKVLQKFCDNSGLKINFDKSHLFLLGPLSKCHPNYLGRFNFELNTTIIKYLGISFSHHREDFFRLNYLPKLSRVKNTLRLWSVRDITPIGKILLIKSFALSQLVFLFMVLPNPPSNYFDELNKLFFNFIWNHKPDKVKRTVLCNTKENGGLNMIDVRIFANSLKTKWVKMYTDDSNRPWKLLFTYALRNYGGDFLFTCNFKRGDVFLSNNFIRDVCDAWASFSFSTPQNDFASQVVLNNSFIKINNQVAYFDVLKQNKVYKVGDFFTREGGVLSYQNFVDKHGIRNFPFTYYYGIILAIPSHWKTNLGHDSGVNLNSCQLVKISMKQRATNLVYRSVLWKNISSPRAVSKWETLFPDYDFDWKLIFMLPHTAVREANIQYLQFRYLHRIVGTNDFLFRVKIKESPLCTFCNAASETIEHLFWNCPVTKMFWEDICSNCLRDYLELDELTVHFGYLENCKSILNFFLLNAKYFIYSCKQKGSKPSAITFYHKFKFSTEVELHILMKQNQFDIANKYRSAVTVL